jgi:formylglycine-generating enzyme required for sulfatase activity
MVVVPAGEFDMGSPDSEPGRWEAEGPRRHVRIRPFAVGKFHVTRGEWAEFVSATQRATTGGCAWSGLPSAKDDAPDPAATWRDFGFPQDDSHPAVCISFPDAQDYVAWLSQQTGQRYRLLSESEWEYASRAGSTSAFPWGSTASHELANYGADSCCSGAKSGRDQWLHTSPAGSFAPNAFGLYDMNGNAMQWVQDCFAPNYDALPEDGSPYEVDKTLNLTGDLSFMSGTSTCAYRVLRGGDANNPPDMIRSAARNFGPPPGAILQEYKSTATGFRVARDLN